MIYCQAIVDVVWAPAGSKKCVFRVTVTAEPPNTQSRVYTITAESDNVAANEGMDRFDKEMAEKPWGLTADGANTGPIA